MGLDLVDKHTAPAKDIRAKGNRLNAAIDRATQRNDLSPIGVAVARELGASILSKEGVPLTDIQKILGHQRATTTDIYPRSIGDLSEAMRKLERK